MKSRKSRQAGISFFGLVIVLVVLGGLAVLAAQVFPTLLEYQAALKAVQKAANEGSTPVDVRSIFDRAAQIDDIKSISGRDLEITKVNDQVVVRFAYNREIHMFGPAHLLLKYTGQSRTTR
ncbi:DUF4845 domain-containing protein [Ramlibacter tataouinensis]|nr:DUF4845 domain-containing protein [Ramlibacter tataouinensis]